MIILKKLFIVGIGVGNKRFITPYAQEIITSCEKVLTTGRIASCFKDAVNMSISEISDALQNNHDETICVLVSGDAGFFSISKELSKKFCDEYEIHIINGLSSIQYFAAKLKTSYDDAQIISMHGRKAGLKGLVSYYKKVFLLTGGEFKAHIICKMLYDCGLGDVQVSVGENLSYVNERIVTETAQVLQNEFFENLSVLLVENKKAVDRFITLKDDDFIRRNTPMTKEEVRAVVLSKLNIKPNDILYDVGAGTGSVSIEMGRKAFLGDVYAIEKEKDAVELIKENRVKHGAFNICTVHGTAPVAFRGLPAPDAVFIGGSAGNLKDIMHCVYEKNPNARFVLTAITLQTLNEIVSMEIPQMEVVSINVAKAKKAGRYDLMTAQNPVYIICF